MKITSKTIATTVALIILISSISVALIGGDQPIKSTDTEGNDTQNGVDDGSDNNDSNNQNSHGSYDGPSYGDGKHIVLVEEATSTSCAACPAVADILYELYDPEDPSFYFISMVDDKASKAHNRLYDEYNVLGFPTVYFDGGYEVIMGGGHEKSLFSQKISNCISRNYADILLNVSADWDDANSELNVTVGVKNNEPGKYEGTLRVYITEIHSRWPDHKGNAFHFAFLDYAIDEKIQLEPYENQSFTNIWTPNFPNVYPENLLIIGAVFNSEAETAYSFPPNNRPFDAYYADATEATRIREGVLPPSIGITFPVQGKQHIDGEITGKSIISSNTYVIGDIPIKVNVEAEAGVEKIEFNVTGLFGKKTGVVTRKPYEWIWNTFAIGKYTITVTVYDAKNRTATDELKVFAFIV
jgi:hypothetical protein